LVVKALRQIEKLRLTLAGVGPEGGPQPIPPAAVYLWQALEPGNAPAYLTPLGELSLLPGQTAWLALTADASQLRAGAYAGRLVAGADGALHQVPVSLRVLSVPAPRSDGFGLWYVGEETAGPLPEPVAAKLADYGVTALTALLPRAEDGRGAKDAARQAARRGLTLLSFGAGEGALPPAVGPPGKLLLPYPDPVWLLRAGGAGPTAVRAAVEAGYAPALLCERLSSVPRELLSRDSAFPFWLVEDGCEPGRVAQMVRSGELRGSEAIWLFLDLRGADWRRAATEVRSAFWAAAWQGLAGAAVRLPPPPGEVDRQLVLWHILRDARREVALWRHARRLMSATPDAPAAAARTLPRLAELAGIVGTSDAYQLVLRAQRRPFRSLYRVSPPA
ncbi:MAG: hypothetical protein KAX19_08685, partial [Candidatus Brocadiae bacterium]|nr:hypothetical protein [Candidatus Brocadiia bacterium]